MRTYKLGMCDLALGGVYELECFEDDGSKATSEVIHGGIDNYLKASEKGKAWAASEK